MAANRVFRDYVTGSAFHLALTKTQISTLSLIANKDWYPTDRCSHFVTAARSLQGKGLVSWKDTRRTRSQKDDAWSLTRAGELAFELLLEAGMTKRYEGTRTLDDWMNKREKVEA